MLISCILLSHNKPLYCREAIASVLDQTHQDWELILWDSGVLHDAGYFQDYRDPRIRLVRSDETEEVRQTKVVASWCFNECLKRKMPKGELVMYLPDDDLLYPNAFQTFVDFATKNPHAEAMYASQDYGWTDGTNSGMTGERLAREMAGRSCNGAVLDCVVDCLQFCHRTSVLDRFPDQEYWVEHLRHRGNADGVFMERVGAITPVYPINVKVCLNRRTPESVNIPM